MGQGRSNYPAVSRGVADSVAAPQEDKGFQDTAITTEQSVDLTDYKGQYIEVEAIGDDYDVCFVEAAATTISTGDIALDAAGAVPRRVYTGVPGKHMVVPASKKVILKYKPVNGTSSTFRVTRA